MTLLNEQTFKPIFMTNADSLQVYFAQQGYDIVQYILPKDRTSQLKFNTLRVYEAEDFDGLKKVIIAVLGWKGETV